ncbi:hypothetical protein ABT010_16330 [Streptomyces sp. NPDC002668]|uniref:hypothetical protein n=1 Tax=Streptomyces sp. NPDC002668 TaxID=3154422 RepID=UPI003330594D
MSRARVWWCAGTYGVLALVAACCTAPAPDVDPTLRKTLRPVVHDAVVAGLEKEGGMLADSSFASTARWFCTEKVVEIREVDGGVLKVGLVTQCSELAARGRTLVEGTAVRGPLLMELSKDGKGGYHVRRQDSPPDGAGYDEWIGRSFSEGGAALVRREDWDRTSTLESAARTHFRLPPDAPVTAL